MGEWPKHKEIKPAVLISSDTVRRLNTEGMRHEWEPLGILDDGRVAMTRMPEGKTGIVLGSGSNMPEWKARGWRTLDIDPRMGADMIADAGQLEQVAPPNSQDYLAVECMPFDPSDKKGIPPELLLQQANRALKHGGTLIIESATFDNAPKATIPHRDEFSKLMAKHGFDSIVELGQYDHIDDGREQKVVYYGKKIAEGFDESRAMEHAMPTYDQNTGKPVQ